MRIVHTILLSAMIMGGLALGGCQRTSPLANSPAAGLPPAAPQGPGVRVLGIAQDAGYPQAGCQKACCIFARQHPEQQEEVVSLGIAQPASGQFWMVEATPDFREQLEEMRQATPNAQQVLPAGIFLTHGHMGHYTGLMHLGREAMGASLVPVYGMPRMVAYLSQNGPWSQLVALQNIELRTLEHGKKVRLDSSLHVTPLLVPHRDEFTETVGYVVAGPKRSLLFIPDIDKWHKWQQPITEVLRTVDIALLDGTFFANGEIPGRDMSLIPHPFMEESLELLKNLPPSEKAKVHFIHFNHTNPVLNPEDSARHIVENAGFNLAYDGQWFDL